LPSDSGWLSLGLLAPADVRLRVDSTTGLKVIYFEVDSIRIEVSLKKYRPLQQEGALGCLGVLDERRMDLMQSRVIAVKPLYTLLQELLAGRTPTGLTATAAVPQRSVRPAGLLR